MNAEKLTKIIYSDFYTGVPDSQLRALCDYLMDTYGIDPKHHIIASNEGNAVGLAAPAIIWRLAKPRSCICRIVVREISSTLLRLF